MGNSRFMEFDVHVRRFRGYFPPDIKRPDSNWPSSKKAFPSFYHPAHTPRCTPVHSLTTTRSFYNHYVLQNSLIRCFLSSQSPARQCSGSFVSRNALYIGDCLLNISQVPWRAHGSAQAKQWFVDLPRHFGCMRVLTIFQSIQPNV